MKAEIYFIGKKTFAITKDFTVYEMYRKTWRLVSQNKNAQHARLTVLARATHTLYPNAEMEDLIK